MVRSPTKSRRLADAILRVGQMVSGPGMADGLSWAQWTALRYLDRANRFSRSPSAFAAFHGTTRGTASQTIRNLIASGYVVRAPSTVDGRSVRLDLTAMGRAALAKDPAEDLVAALDDLPPAQRSNAGATLDRLIGALSQQRSVPTFGSCSDCRHRGDLPLDPDRKPHCECRFAQAVLAPEETAQLCIHFQPAPPWQVLR